MAIPRTAEADEARLHDRRPETWLSAAELQRVAELCAVPLTADAVRELDGMGDRLATYRFAISTTHAEVFPADPVVLMDATSVAADIAERRRRDAAQAWAKAAGQRWRDVHRRFGFER